MFSLRSSTHRLCSSTNKSLVCHSRHIMTTSRLLKKKEYASWTTDSLRPSDKWMPGTSRPYAMYGDTASSIVFEEAAGVKVAVLNRPKVLNALNEEMIDILTPNIHKWQNGNSTYAIVLRSINPKAFCAGGDIKAVVNAAVQVPRKTNPLEFFRKEYQLNHLIGSSKIAVVSFMEGITMGGGVGLSIHGDFRVASENTVFAMPETAIGFFPDVGATHRLTKLPVGGMPLARYLCLTGARLDAADLIDVGICTHFVPVARLPFLIEYLSMLHDDTSKAAVGDIISHSHAERLADDKSNVMKDMDKIQKHFSPSTVEEIVESLQSDSSEFAKKALHAIQASSPLSLKVTMKQLEFAEKSTLEQCLQMDYNIAAQYVSGTKSDFYEGVRAQVIDKTKDPKWSPNSLSDVTNEMVNEFIKEKDLLPFLKTHLSDDEYKFVQHKQLWGNFFSDNEIPQQEKQQEQVEKNAEL